MAITPWEIKGREFSNCNCSYGCPCQFNALPTQGYCCAVVGFHIESGHFGSVRLDGLRGAGVYSWPGPVHLGNGRMQLIVDERADPGQRDALTRIMLGQDTQDMATMWWVYAAMSPNRREPLFAPIAFEVDVEARRAKISAKGFIEMLGEPIRNPVTGDEHRVRIGLPHGFEYRIAEIGSAATKTTGTAIDLNLQKSYGQFAHLHLSNKGVV